jgi:hypothetical protein
VDGAGVGGGVCIAACPIVEYSIDREKHIWCVAMSGGWWKLLRTGAMKVGKSQRVCASSQDPKRLTSTTNQSNTNRLKGRTLFCLLASGTSGALFTLIGGHN